jgi:hypothetical protein
MKSSVLIAALASFAIAAPAVAPQTPAAYDDMPGQ